MESVLFWFYGGVFIGLLVCVILVLKYKRQESFLLDQVAVLEDSLNAAPEGFLAHVRPVGKQQEEWICSARFRILFNLADEQVSLKSVLDVLNASDKIVLKQAFERLEKHQQRFDIVVRGEVESAVFRLRGMVLSSGNRPAVILWAQNIAEQKFQQAEKQAELEKAKERIAQLTTLLNALHLPVMLTNGVRDILFKNTACQRVESLEENSTLRWKEVVIPDLINQSLILQYAQDTTREENLENLLADALKANQGVLKELSADVCLFDAHGKMIFFNKSFSELWHLETYWLKKEPSFDAYLNKLQEKGFLPQVKDFAQYKKEQADRFSLLAHATEELIYLPNNRIIRRLLIPYSQGSVLFVDEDKTIYSADVENV